MKLALEIPIAILEDIYPLTDLGFSLAHLILKNKKYRDFYKIRIHIMDNSMYELGDPMPFDDLLSAIRESRPKAIIAPDWEGKAHETSKAVVMMNNHLGEIEVARPSVGVVVQGCDLTERMHFFLWAQANGFKPICFPFRLREERNRLIGSLASSHRFNKEGWYHLLGISQPHELDSVRGLDGEWSCDTGKPCKPDFKMRADRWSGRGRLNLHRGYTYQEVEQVKDNVEYLRTLL